jgi:hypothetical protein
VGAYVWQDLTDAGNEGFPAGACAISISAQGNDAWIKVLTTGGEVWETHGDTAGTTFVWDEDWVELTTPVPAAAASTRHKGGLTASVTPNRVPMGEQGS